MTECDAASGEIKKVRLLGVNANYIKITTTTPVPALVINMVKILFIYVGDAEVNIVETPMLLKVKTL